MAAAVEEEVANKGLAFDPVIESNVRGVLGAVSRRPGACSLSASRAHPVDRVGGGGPLPVPPGMWADEFVDAWDLIQSEDLAPAGRVGNGWGFTAKRLAWR